ncbi:MAG: murein biosynthesis integral membrane protein MurJ, partial [Pseudomonadota bacterium]|nr:murein biosynthesis integral membrane protein MurJ [Pseudomonadota bacterium]
LLRLQPGWGRLWLQLGLACVVMAATVLALRWWVGDWTAIPSLLHRAFWLLLVVTAGGVAYVLSLLALGLRPRHLRH